MEKTFHMLYLQDGGAPTYKHENFDSAKEEAERLSIKFNKDVYVLKALCVIKPAPKTITENLDQSNGDDLPF
jgi:hypothetical protein